MYPFAVRGLHGAALAAMVIGITAGAVSAQCGAPPVPAAMPAVLRDYRPVTAAGGVVFSGGTSDRKRHAFDAATGKLLWEFPMNSGALAPPSSFSVDGKQYIAVETGWGGDSRGMQATLNNLFPGEYPEGPEGGAVWVFALE